MPLDPKLNKFSTASPVIATFDFTDLASGTGFITFFLTTSEGSSGTEYNMTDRATVSNNVFLSNNNTFTFQASPFNMARTLKGDTILEVAVKVLASSSQRTINVIGTLKLVSDTTTTIATFAQIGKSATVNTYFLGSAKTTIDRIDVKVGDYLTLEIVLAGHAGFGKFYVDPNLQETGVLGTSQINIPFLSDL